MKKQTVITFILLLFSTIGGISAQSTDTMYVVKRQVVHDTVYVRDTVRVQDTVIIADYIHSEEFKQLFYELNGVDGQTSPDSLEKLWAQTVTFLENRVIQYEQQNVSTMDSIKKYGLAGLMLLGLNSLAPAQTPSPSPTTPHQTKVQKVLHDSPFNGFHFGYTAEADFVHPVEMTSTSTGKKSFSSMRYGGRFGLECSYHFADYFGVSAALDLGYIGLGRTAIDGGYMGISMPLKFEFHHPVADILWITANAGVQLRMPFKTFLSGYNKNEGAFIPNYHLYIGNSVAEYLNYRYNRRVFYADLMADVGLYYQLPNQDYLRFLLGLNIATTDFANGNVLFYTNNGDGSQQFVEGPLPTEKRYVSQRNHYLYFQIAYLHSFSKQRAIKQAQPHWNDDKSFYRHEFRLGVSDPLGFTYLRELFASPILGEPIEGVSPTKQIFTPVFSLDYHYRASKWFWLGLTTGYNLYEEKGYGEPEHLTWKYKEHHFLIMPSLRFSYLNRPHLTLYSGLSVGLYIKHGREYRDDDLLIRPITTDHNRVFSAFQLTAFGVKAGAKHWFGSFELGAGIKGFANLGVGYEF